MSNEPISRVATVGQIPKERGADHLVHFGDSFAQLVFQKDKNRSPIHSVWILQYEGIHYILHEIPKEDVRQHSVLIEHVGTV